MALKSQVLNVGNARLNQAAEGPPAIARDNMSSSNPVHKQAVEQIQVALSRLGYGPAGGWNSPGSFGPATEAAVKAFQQKVWPSSSQPWVDYDGRVGKGTLTKMDDLLSDGGGTGPASVGPPFEYGPTHINLVVKYACRLFAECGANGLRSGSSIGTSGNWTAKSENSKFYFWTERLHKSLVDAWNHNSPVTTCNEFTGIWSQRMGAAPGKKLCQVTLDGQKGLRSTAGKSWVPGSEYDPPNRIPRPGDIFHITKPKGGHVGVVLEGSSKASWAVVESGQGGNGYGYDLILYHWRSMSSVTLDGWVDLEKYIYS